MILQWQWGEREDDREAEVWWSSDGVNEQLAETMLSSN